MTCNIDENESLSDYARSVEIAREAVRSALQAAGLNPEYRVLPNDVPTAVLRRSRLVVKLVPLPTAWCLQPMVNR